MDLKINNFMQIYKDSIVCDILHCLILCCQQNDQRHHPCHLHFYKGINEKIVESELYSFRTMHK